MGLRTPHGRLSQRKAMRDVDDLFMAFPDRRFASSNCAAASLLISAKKASTPSWLTPPILFQKDCHRRIFPMTASRRRCGIIRSLSHNTRRRRAAAGVSKNGTVFHADGR